SADAAILVVDALEGMREQTRRHAYLLSLLGVSQVVVVINKMDAVGYDEAAFGAVRAGVEDYLDSIGVTALHVVPISARSGDMIAGRGDGMDWYRGKSLVEVLDLFEGAPAYTEQALRFPVQDVYRYGEKRILVGRVETGILRKGDML